MTTDNKTMYEMLQSGSTYQEIADLYGISKQAVHQRVYRHKRKLDGIRGRHFDIDKIVYKGIYDWFQEHFDESLSSLILKVYGHKNNAAVTKFRGFLVGNHDTHFKTEHIKRLCELTGKTYEDLFERR